MGGGYCGDQLGDQGDTPTTLLFLLNSDGSLINSILEFTFTKECVDTKHADHPLYIIIIIMNKKYNHYYY